jgi:hypothetical protein
LAVRLMKQPLVRTRRQHQLLGVLHSSLRLSGVLMVGSTAAAVLGSRIWVLAAAAAAEQGWDPHVSRSTAAALGGWVSPAAAAPALAAGKAGSCSYTQGMATPAAAVAVLAAARMACGVQRLLGCCGRLECVWQRRRQQSWELTYCAWSVSSALAACTLPPAAVGGFRR